MKTVIFIKSYRKDFPWLAYCLRSIKKFCSGYEGVVLCVPHGDRAAVPFGGVDDMIVIETADKQQKDGYLYQQVVKICADLFCPGMTHILYVDSDNCFNTSNTPESWLKDGKPIIWYTPYSALVVDGKAQTPWQPITEKALGMKIEFECMRRFPIMSTPEALRGLREHIEKVHHMPFADYVLSQPRGQFSEFNALGAYCMAKMSDKFTFINTLEYLPKALLNQHWSWGGLTDKIKAELEAILK